MKQKSADSESETPATTADKPPATAIINPDMATDRKDIYGTRWSETAGPGHPPASSAHEDVHGD